jgi:triphosphoribosyl-dephospho-CoA synthase
MDALRKIGIEAERAMLERTGGANTHRGAIFGLGLLCAAAGAIWPDSTRSPSSWDAKALCEAVRRNWGTAILRGPIALRSHGTEALRQFGVCGARGEAAAGFPHAIDTGLPALRLGRLLAPADPEAARVHSFFSLLATVDDTNLLYRGGEPGLRFAREQAAEFLSEDGVGNALWRKRAEAVHREFVARSLSPGGCADLLGITLFLDALEAGL